MSFRPRGGNVRRKQRSAVDSDDDDIDEIAKKLSKAKTAPRSSAAPAKPVVKKLSLEDEELGEEIFKKKKKKPKARGVSTVTLNDTGGENGEGGGASYSAAALSDLKSQTPQMPSRFAGKGKKVPLATEGPAVIKISGSFRSNVSAKSHESAMPETFKMPAKPDADAFGIQPPAAAHVRPPRVRECGAAAAGNSDKAGTQKVQGEEGGSDGADGDFNIPTAELIRKAKEKRLRLRGAHMAPGYVPSDHPDFKALKDFKKTEDAVKKGSDDDDSGEEPEEDIRLKFSGVSVKEKRRIHKPVVPPDQHDDEEGGSGSDGDQFAAAQVRRALGSAAAAPLAAWRRDAKGATGVVRQAAAAANAAGSGSAAARGAAALRSIQEMVSGIQQRRDAAKQAAQRTTVQVAASAAEAVDADEKFREADERYRFMQSLRAYTRDLCECLNHKIADVEALEEERLAAMQELYADARREREEVSAELMVPAAAAVAALQRQEDPDAAAQSAEAAAQQQAVPEKLDEFGRDENAVRRERACARAKARTVALVDLKKRFESSPAAALCDSTALAAAARGADVGATGGHEAQSERAAYYAKRLGELQEVASHVLDDAAPEFASMQALLAKVDEFKRRFPAQYQTAYMSESLPALVSVYVRLQLLSWDPLFQGGGGDGQPAAAGQVFMDHAWFQQLINFSSGENDPDDDLVPAVVAQVLAKHSFSPMLKNAWDPCIRTASESVRSTLDALLVFETASTRDNLFALVDTVVDALAQAADDTAVPLWPPCVLLHAPIAAAAASVAWDNVVTLLASVCSFQGFLSQELLAKVAGSQLLHRHVVPVLDAYVKDAEALVTSKSVGGQAGSKRGVTAHVPLAVAFQKLLSVAAILPNLWLQGGSSGGEGAKVVLPLTQVARNALRLVGGPGGLRGVKIEEDAERVRLCFRL